MALREILADFGFSIDTKAMDEAENGVSKLLKSVGGLGRALVAAAALFPIVKVVQWGLETATAIDAQDKFAAAIGASAREVAQWESIMADSGATVEQTRLGIRTFEKQVTAAAAGSAEAAKSMRLLGVRSRDAQGNLRPLGDRLDDAVVGLASVEDAARRAAIAEQLFGEAGLAFVRAGQNGAEAIANLRAEFDELNPDYEDTVERARRTAAAMDRFRKASDALSGRVAAALLPALERVVSFVSRAIDGFTRLVAGTKILEVGLVTLGVVLAGLAGVLLAPFLPAIAVILAVAAAIGAVVLVVEDLYQMFTGGESAIAAALDDLLGVGTAKRVVETVTEAARDLWEWLKRVGEVAVQVFRAMAPIVETLARVQFAILRGAIELVVATIRVLVALGQALAEIYGDVLGGISDLFTGLGETARIVADAIREAYRGAVDFVAEQFEALSMLFTGTAEGIQQVWERVMDALRSAIDRVLGPARTAFEYAKGIGEFLFGDDEELIERRRAEAETRAGAVRGLGANLGALIGGTSDPAATRREILGNLGSLITGVPAAAPTPLAPSSGRVFSSIFQPTINVTTQASDPAEVARVVAREIEEREQRVLRDLREDWLGS